MEGKKDKQWIEGSPAYVWEQADFFMRQWLSGQDYRVRSSEKQEDCIGYRCVKNEEDYTIFVYAFGEAETIPFGGDYCLKLMELLYAKKSTVLVLYLHVDRKKSDDGQWIYKVENYDGWENTIELWRVATIQSKNVLELYFGKENDMIFHFVAAYNSRSIDAFEAILAPNASIEAGEDLLYHEFLYERLSWLMKEFGEMKLAHISLVRDGTFLTVPYIENVGAFLIGLSSKGDKISKIPVKSWDIDEALWITDVSEDDDPFGTVPDISEIEFLAPEVTQPFAVKLTFENGEVKKYSLPIEKQRVVQYGGYPFTDKIWRSGKLVAVRQKKKKDSVLASFEMLENYGQGIDFINGYSIGKIELYHDSKRFIEPTMCHEIVFENDKLRIRKIAQWPDCSLWWWKKTYARDGIGDEGFGANGIREGVFKVSLPGGNVHDGTKESTCAGSDGMRVTNLEFNYMDYFHEGVARVRVSGFGAGYINKDLDFVVEPRYRFAEVFSEGYAVAYTDDTTVYVDKDGNERPFGRAAFASGEGYKSIWECSDGMFKVSLLVEEEIPNDDLDDDYYDDDDKRYILGYVDVNGVEVIPPQYIFARDFHDGLALVCKGNEEYGENGWGSREKLWGFIDKAGNEVIPCMYDEVQFFQNSDMKTIGQYFKVRSGDFPGSKWGIINRQGERIEGAYFEEIGCTLSSDGCFAFYTEKKGRDRLVGIYSIPEQRVLFAPQFLSVDFSSDGNFCVKVFDETLGRKVWNVIDRSGQPLLPSKYSYGYERKGLYEVEITEETDEGWSRICGLVDREGAEILPCKYNASSLGGIDLDRQSIICKSEATSKYGMVRFDGSEVIPAIYEELRWASGAEFLIAKAEEDAPAQSLLLADGTEVLPAKYKSIDVNDHTILAYDMENNSGIVFRIESFR